MINHSDKVPLESLPDDATSSEPAPLGSLSVHLYSVL